MDPAQTIGILGYGACIPRLRLSRRAVAQANAWYAPQFLARACGTRSLANWDEDSITLAVAAARDCLGPAPDRSHVGAVTLASGTLPFAERLNAGVVCEALTLREDVEASDVGGSQRAALGALLDGLAKARAIDADVLVLAADNRITRAGSAQELDSGDAAAALLIGRGKVIAEVLGSATLTADFVDRFRATGQAIDYHWEERWVRDEGIAKLVPRVVGQALERAGVAAAQVDHFIFPTTFQKIEGQLAQACGIGAAAVADGLADSVGETGVPHGLLLLAHVLERAQPGQHIVLAQFGGGAQALVLRTTAALREFQPQRGVGQWLSRGVEELHYTKFLSFKQQLQLERGMRGEQDKKTALSTAWRHRAAILGLVAGKCSQTGSVHFPPSRLSYDAGQPLLDTQQPHKLADRAARVLSWSAETLSYHMAPPHHYGQIDFEGGGRILMDFTDLDAGEVDSGTPMEMVFRVKDRDEQRGYVRYFWKATPVRDAAGRAIAKE